MKWNCSDESRRGKNAVFYNPCHCISLTSRDKSSNWWRDKVFVACHWTFVIIQHYPFLKKYKYFKTNIENKSFWCNKLHSLLRFFSLLKSKGLHPKNNWSINVEQSLEEKLECKPLFQFRSEKQKYHTMYFIFFKVTFIVQQENLALSWFCLSSYPIFLRHELLLPAVVSTSPMTILWSCRGAILHNHSICNTVIHH